MMRSAVMTVLMRCATMNTVACAVSSRSAARSLRVGGEVERGEAVVEHVHVGPPDDRARNGQPLLLSARQVDAALRDRRRELLRHRVDEVDRLRHGGGVAHLLVGRVLAAVADVGGHRSGEEHGLLRDEADARAQIGLGHVTHVDAVQQHLAVVGVVEARDQPGQRRFAGAGAADDRGDFARMRRERDARQRRFLGARILERHVPELHVAAPVACGGRDGVAGSAISGCTSSTSLMRAADADARGNITNMAVTMNTANRICIAYCSEANIAPTCMTPASMRWLPTQMIARLVKLSIRISAGISTAISRLTRDRGVGQIEVRAIEPFALPGAAIERTNHADTAQPLAEHELEPIDLALHGRGQRHRAAHDEREHTAITGMTAISTHASCASCDSARITPPIAIIGAVITMVSIMIEHLLHLGGVVGRPGDQRGRAEAARTGGPTGVRRAREDRAAQVPPEAGRHLRRVIAAGDRAQGGDHRHQQHQAADLEDGALSPRTMPRSTISDVSRGSHRFPSDCARASTRTNPISRRWGVRKRVRLSMAPPRSVTVRYRAPVIVSDTQ